MRMHWTADPQELLHFCRGVMLLKSERLLVISFYEQNLSRFIELVVSYGKFLWKQLNLSGKIGADGRMDYALEFTFFIFIHR